MFGICNAGAFVCEVGICTVFDLLPWSRSAIGRRSGLFTKRMLEEHPSIEIRNHIGGILDWSHVNGPLMDRTKQTTTNRIFFTGGGHLKHLPNRGNLDILLPEDLPAAAT